MHSSSRRAWRGASRHQPCGNQIYGVALNRRVDLTQGGLSRSEPLITRETPWYVAAGLLLSSFGLFFDLLERTEFPPWLKTTQAVASALLVPTTVPLIMARFRVRRGVFASPARGPTVSHTGLRRHRPHHIL